jgi:VWFA-related protein
MRPRDRALVITFDHDVKLLSPLSEDQKELEETIKGAQPGDYVGTRLRDAVLEVTAKRFKNIAGRKAVILLSDGQDFGSGASIPDLLASVAESGVLIYSVFYKVDIRALSRELFGVAIPGQLQDPIWQQREREAAAFLQELSELSAGRFMPSEISHLNDTFAQIMEELRHQYLLGFYPEATRLDGSLHTLSVVVEREGAVVRARRDYRVLRQK